ncbi:MAG TPA: choice-of-anchor P family protein [Mycobacteriales bacterium]|nr:choice-of-anchor P family protein [Mycobacteriales bacterium]
MAAVPLMPASAQITGSSFNAKDGNLTVEGTEKDWANVTPFFFGIDKATGKNDDSFSGGVDEDTVNPGVGTGSIPNSKDDLARFYVSFEKAASGDELLYLAWVRNKTSGSADMDFELNQSTAKASDGLPVRTPGDVLVTYEFTSTKTPDIRLQRWITSGSGCVTASAPPCWANRVILDASNSEAMVNDGFPTSDPGRYLTPAKATTLLSQTFGEAAINLSKLGVFSSNTCTRLAKAFAKTRSSQSFNSSMQDLIAPIDINFSNCVTKTFDVSAAAGVPSGTTLYAVYTTPDGVKHSLALSPGTAGHLTGSDPGIQPGATLTGLHLELRTATGSVVWKNSDQTETLTESSTNAGAFTYGVTLAPASAENFTNKPHTLTATVTGTGSLNGTSATTAPLVGVPVGFRLEGGTPSGCGSLSSTSGTTDAAGQATTVLTSANACTTTIRAFVDKAGSTAGYDSSDASGTASKTFAAYAVSVSPATATNALGTNHTFTIKVTRDTGSGAAGYAGQTVTFLLSNATATGAHLVSINGVAASGTSGTCTTSSTGTCTVVATATNTGTFTLDASYGKSNDSGAGTFTGSGTKSYTDYRLGVTPASATNQLNVPHTFTVLLEQSTNNTWSPLAGATVALALTKTAGDAAITSINGVSGSGTSCVTKSDGTCSVVINATQPGLVTLTATYSKALDSGTLTRTASGTKQYSGYDMTVTPATATNDLQHLQHTFTVSLTRNNGSSSVGYAGQTVTLSLDPGTSGATITSINGVAGSGTSCVTTSDGTCSVVITATSAGKAVLTATWTQALSATESVTRTASGTKQYSDFRLDVTPESATNDLQHLSHTFTVTLQRNDGSGFAGYGGQTVSLSLNPGTSGATITSINGVAGSGTSCVTKSDGTCSVVITATKAGQAVLTASYSQVLSSTDTVTRTDSGTKQYSDFALTVSPLTAVNDLNQPHTFTVTLTRNDGSGFTGYAGQTVSLSLNPGTTDGHFTDVNGSPASGIASSCVTRADGTCAVTIVSSTPGKIVLTASWSQVLTGHTATRTATADKTYLSLSVAKNACNTSAPVGGLLRFDIPWSVAGASLTNARIVDNLPAGLTFVSASPAASSAPAVGSTGQVVWTLPTPLADGASGTMSIVVSLAQAGTWTNTGAFQADGGINRTFSSTVSTSNGGASASGRAYGLTAALAGSTLLAPTPDTDKKNPDSLLTLGIPPLAPTLLSGTIGVVPVANNRSVTASGAEDEAVATVADVNLVVAGVPITAKVVAARSDSVATGSYAESSMAGSQVVGLKIGTGVAQDYSFPTVVPVVNLLGVKVAEIAVLEQVGRSGAALGGAAGAQPQGGAFNSGLGVNGLHIRLIDGTVDVIVAHADSKAAFPTLSPCAATGSYLVGSAFVASETLDYPTGPTTLSVVPVTLGSAGGSQSGAANALDLAVIGATSGTGTASTDGVLSVPRVDSDAAVEKLVLKNGATTVISATLVHAHSSVNGLSPSGTTIAKLVLGGTDLCVALGLTSTCTPAPNTKLLDLSKTLTIVLNEQIVAGGVRTVNAVHVYVLGAGNPLGLPIGSDLIISSATAGTGA